MKGDRIDLAVEKRQKVLDFLADHPHCSKVLIASALGWRADATGKLVDDMVDMGEVQKHGKRHLARFTACKRTTKSAADIRAALQSRKSVGRRNDERPKDFQKSKRDGMPGVTVNKSNKPTKNPGAGGQGATVSVSNGFSPLGGVW